MPTARTGHRHLVSSVSGVLPPRPRHAFLRAWFERLGAAPAEVVRLGTTAEEGLEHLLAAPVRSDPARMRFDRLMLADVAVASAAVRGSAEAWRLVDAHAPLLTRALDGLRAGDHPAAAAKRFLDRVRVDTACEAEVPHNLRRYRGDRPLRVWLVDRLLGAHASELRGPATPAASVRLRLAIEMLESQRERVRSVVGIAEQSSVHRLVSDAK